MIRNSCIRRLQSEDGTAKVEGDVSILAKLAATMMDFDPRFEILPGTRGREEVIHANPSEAVPATSIPE